MDNDTLKKDAIALMRSVLAIAVAASYTVKGGEMSAIFSQFQNLERLIEMLESGEASLVYTEVPDNGHPDETGS